MSLGAQIRAGSAFIELKSKDSGFTRGLRKAERRLKAFGKTMGGIGRKIGLMAAVFAPVAIAAIKFASDAEESASRFKAVFGSLADDSAKWADELARRVGRAKVEVIDSLSSMQSFFVGLGLDNGQAQKMSQQLTELSIDFASFNNITDDDAMGRFISALSGSSEVLARFGINTKAAALQQELLTMGITKSWSAVTEQEKAMARYSIILRTMTDQGALGDATRTAGSFANQMKRLRANLINAATAIGKSIMPPLAKLLKIINPILTAFAEWADANKKAVATAAAVVTAVGALAVGIIGIGLAFGFAGFAISGFLAVMAALGTIAGVVGGAIAFLISPLGLLIGIGAILGMTLLNLLVDFKAVADYARGTFSRVLASTLEVFDGIKNAIMKGDIALAFKIMTKSIELVWVGMLGTLKTKWFGFTSWLLKQFGVFQIGLGFTSEGLDTIANAAGNEKGEAAKIKRELADIKKQLDRLIDEASKPPAPATPGGDGGPGLNPALDGFGGNTGGERSVRGTFNNFGLGGLVTPVEKSIEENTKRTAQAVERIEENTRAGGAVFA